MPCVIQPNSLYAFTILINNHTSLGVWSVQSDCRELEHLYQGQRNDRQAGENSDQDEETFKRR